MTINITTSTGTGAGPVLDIDHLKVTFATDAGDVYAVKDVSLQVNPGEVVAIVGESAPGRPSPRRPSLACCRKPRSAPGRC